MEYQNLEDLETQNSEELETQNPENMETKSPKDSKTQNRSVDTQLLNLPFYFNLSSSYQEDETDDSEGKVCSA